jgi:hypothetical protein
MEDDKKIPIIIWADLERAPLGQRSKLLEDFCGRPLLRQTLERVCRTTRSGPKVVYCLPGQAAKIQSVLSGLPVEVVGVEYELPGWWPGVQAARKWAVEGWRGGVLGACAFDEDLLPHVVGELGRRFKANAVMMVAAHGPWVDPEILDRQMERYWEHAESTKINFTQAPPGLSGFIMQSDMIEQLPATSKIAGSIIGYHPDRPQIDIISMSCNLSLDPSIIETPVRFICDMQRTLDLARRLAGKVNPQTAGIAEITQAARQEFCTFADRCPKEIELELLTGWAWEKGYRPQPGQSRGPLDPELILKRVAELTKHCDDLLVHIAGFGEPTRHPQFAEIVHGLKQAGVWGISLATGGLFEAKIAEKIVDLPLDILTFQIDVPHRELYREIMGHDGYPTIQENIDRMTSLLQSHRHPTPLLVPVMIKTYGTMELMKDFFDEGYRKVGWAVIEGFSDYAGQISDLAVNSMAGPNRRGCRQINGRLTVLADGQAVICNQDFNGVVPAGSLRDQSILDLWRGTVLGGLRAAHRGGDYSLNALCGRCRQWHRP